MDLHMIPYVISQKVFSSFMYMDNNVCRDDEVFMKFCKQIMLWKNLRLFLKL